ncbi:hypothetical protein ACU8V1_23605 [Rhizobium leguminosarum]
MSMNIVGVRPDQHGSRAGMIDAIIVDYFRLFVSGWWRGRETDTCRLIWINPTYDADRRPA